MFIPLLFLPFLIRAENYDAELISQKTEIIVSTSSLTKKYSLEIKINNRSGEEYAEISIPFSKMSRVSKISACIKDANGNIVRKLKSSEISQRSAISDFSLYEDDFVKEFTLVHNQYPYSIVCSYESKEDDYLQIENWNPIIDNLIPTRYASLKLTIPYDYSISYLSRLIDKPKVDTLGKSITYEWNASFTNTFSKEKFTAPTETFVPSLIIVPVNFKYESVGSMKDWISYGNWQNSLLEGINVLPLSEQQKIDELTNGVMTEVEKIRILYHHLQDATRYINVTLKTGGLKPYSAAYVSENKYGDCKALTNFMKSMLDYVGIKSYYTKVFAGDPIRKIEKDFVSQQFNHVILCVPLSKDTIWLDCTSKMAFNFLGTFTQNRDVLIIEKDNSHFTKTPSLKVSEVLESRNAEISYSERGNSPIVFINQYRGEMYENLRSMEQSKNEIEKNRILRNYFIENGFELLNYKISLCQRDSLQISTSYEVNAPHVYKHYGNEILVSNIPFSLSQFEKPESRKLPVQIDYPIYKKDTLVYEIPALFRLSNIPPTQSITTRFGEYKIEFIHQDKSIMVVKSLQIYSGSYPISEYKAFYQFYTTVENFEHSTFITLIK